MDAVPMYSKKLWHPQDMTSNSDFTGRAKHYTRTEFPVKYFYIDFGLSRKYDPGDASPRELPILGGDRSVPEFQGDGYDAPADPFPTDIYYLGNLMRQAFLDVRCAICVCIRNSLCPAEVSRSRLPQAACSRHGAE